MSTQDLSGRVALVAGASHGTGAAIAGTLAAAGAKVIGAAASESDAAAISERLTQWGDEGHALDSAEPKTIGNLIADIEKRLGKLDILVNDAGVTRDNLPMRMEEEEWDGIMQVNLKSVFRASRVVLHGMMEQRAGRTISITPVIDVMGSASQTNYVAARAGLVGFSKSMAREVGSRDITVNCVTPGFIDTNMTRALPKETQKAFGAQTSLGKFGEAQDIADAVLFLTSDQAKCITDQTLRVNNDMLMP